MLISPIRMPNVGDLTVVGLATGPIVIEDPDVLTSARVPGGIVLERDFRTNFIDRTHGNKVTLVVDPAHATFGVAWHIAEQINNDVYPVLHTKPATALGPDRIEVLVPDLYRDDPVAFLAWLLKVDVMSPQTEARVSINTKSKTVIIHGDVQISPVVISQKNLKVEVAGTGTGEPAPVCHHQFTRAGQPAAVGRTPERSANAQGLERRRHQHRPRAVLLRKPARRV